jgi:hypothetical protein
VPPAIDTTPKLPAPDIGTAQTSCENADILGAIAEGTGIPFWFIVVVLSAHVCNVHPIKLINNNKEIIFFIF